MRCTISCAGRSNGRIAHRLVLGRTGEREPVFWGPDFVTRATRGCLRILAPGRWNSPLIATEWRAGTSCRARSPLSAPATCLGRLCSAGTGAWPKGIERRPERVAGARPACFPRHPSSPRPARSLTALLEARPTWMLRGLAPGLGRGTVPRLVPSPRLCAVRSSFVGANASGTFDVKPSPIGPGGTRRAGAMDGLGKFRHRLHHRAVVARDLRAPPSPGAAILSLGSNRSSLRHRWQGRDCRMACSSSVRGCCFPRVGSCRRPRRWRPPRSSLLGVVIENFWREQRRKREIQTMFGAYVDPGVASACP